MISTDPVRTFQSLHRNHLGKPLAVDGVKGPQTNWAMAVARLGRRRREAILASCSYVGLTEDPPGSNDEPTGTIDGWCKGAGVAPGNPYCAAAASAWLGLRPRFASAQALGKAFRETHPFAGVIMWYSTGPWQGHCGVVIGYDPRTQTVMVVEANCDNAVRVVRRYAPACRFSDPFEEEEWPVPVINSVPFRVTRATLEGTR